MAFKIKDNLDLSGFTINRFCIDAQAELPNTGTIGAGRKLFYTGAGDFNNHELVYDGTSFRALAFLDEVANNKNFTELIDRVAAVEGKFTGSKAKDADKLDGNDSSYFATASALNDLSTKVNAFFDGTVDVDNVIDNLKDIQDFLDNYSDATNLSSILATKADKATTLEGYGITNAYTKTQADELFLTTEDVVNSGNTLSFGSAIIIGTIGGEQLTAALPSVASVKTSLGLGSLAYKSSLVASDIPDLSEKYLSTAGGEITSSELPLTINRTGGTAAYSSIGFEHNGVRIGILGYDLVTKDLVTRSNAEENETYYTVLHNGNAKKWVALIDGSNASGNWGINIKGNAATATKLADETAFEAWGQTFFENGKPKSVTGALDGVTNINSSVYINSSGHVGLGVPSPSERLHVKGNIYVEGNIVATGEVSAGGAGEEGSAGGGSGASIYATSIAKSQTSVTINHGLNTRDVVISIYEKDSESTSEVWNMILTDIEIVDANNIQVTFGSATTVEHKAVIFGAA